MSHLLTRRSFLSQSAVATSAVCLGTRGAVAAPPNMRLGLVTYMWAAKWDLPTLITRCQKTRVLGVELRTTHKHGVEPSLSVAERRDVKKRFDDSDVTCVGPGSNERFDNPDPAKVRQAIEKTKAFVKLSHDIGGTGVKVKPDRFWPNVPRQKTIEQIGKSLNELGAFAADYGQEIRLEVHGPCAQLPTIKAIMDLADHKHVAVCWNSNAQDLQGEGLEHNFNLVKDRLGDTCHVRPLDDPSYPYEKLLDLLVEAKYAGWVMIESGKVPSDVVKALAEQRALFDRMVRAAAS